jgi:putative transposase
VRSTCKEITSLSFEVAPPSIAPSPIAHTLKGTTGRLVFQRFPEVKKHLWGGAFWSRSYYVGSVGDMSVDTVLKEIELGQDSFIPLLLV